MKSLFVRLMLASVVLVALTLVVATDASAQCSTCAVPTVAYQPVVAQPTVAYQPYTGWYPGKWLDQWRLRRAGVAASAPAYSAAYAPSYYSAAYAPSYTAAYAPTYRANYATNYTAAYRRPYVTAYAPLSYAAAAPCNTCTHTVARQVLLRPVVAAPACNVCNYTPSCGCDVCSAGVSQASYDAPYSEPGCSGCSGGGSVSSVLPAVPAYDSRVPSYDSSYDSRNESSILGSQTRQPEFSPVVPAPEKSRYDSNRPIDSGNRHDHVHSHGHDHDHGSPADDAAESGLDELDPRPATEADPSTYYNAPYDAPRLFDPSDRTARSKTRSFKTRSYKQTHKPTVDVWTAVYRGPTKHRSVSNTTRRPARTQAEIDADGWVAVPRSR